jgi:hypothetical protein
MVKLVSGAGLRSQDKNNVFESAHKRSTQRLEEAFKKLTKGEPTRSELATKRHSKP